MTKSSPISSQTIESSLIDLQSSYTYYCRLAQILIPQINSLSEMYDSRPMPSEFVLPPLHFLAPLESTQRRRIGGEVAGGPDNWSIRNPHAGRPQSWDGTSATAHQLVRLSREASARPGLHHERPVTTHPLRKLSLPICDALDLDDLQSPFSWDMYGVMEVADTVSNEGIDGTLSQSWMDTV